jgi:hypothetical protein
MIIFVRSIIVRKRTVIEKRLLELIEFVEFMLNHKEEVKELFKKVFPDYLIEYDPLLDVPQQANLNTLFQNDDLRLALAEVVLPELLKQENFLMLLIEIANKSDDENPPHLIAKEMPAELKEKIKGPSFLKEMKSESGITSLTKALLKKPSLVQQLFAELLKRQEDAIQAALNMKDNGDEL